MSRSVLVRYGAIPEVAHFAFDLPGVPARGESVVVLSHRGLELGTLLEGARSATPAMNGHDQPVASEPDRRVLRRASPHDVAQHDALRAEAQASYGEWQRRIREWNLELELIDLEWTLDRQKLVLYVLGGRGAETTKLALQAAAAGLAVIEVQPVDAQGPVAIPTGGGCGSGACGCHDSHPPAG